MANNKTKKLNHITTFDVVLASVMAVLVIIILYPFYNAFLISIVPQNEYLTTPLMLWPTSLDLTSYKFVIDDGMVLSGMWVTTLVLFFGVAYNMLLTVCTAFALTKPFPGNKLVSYLFIFTMYFSGGLIPYYLLIRDLGLMDSIFSMVLPTGISFSYMIIIKKNFENIPKEMEESAYIDGASDLKILFSIFLPVSLPILATFALYYGVERWNEWWNGMLFIKSVDKQPLQLILRSIIMDASNITESSSSEVTVFGEGVKMASTVISMIPIMCLYPFLQRFFVSGLTMGAVKG